MFNEKFLKDYQSKLYYHLQELFYVNIESLYCFLLDEYTYKGRDWYTGETWSVSLSDSIRYQEKIKMDEIKKKL